MASEAATQSDVNGMSAAQRLMQQHHDEAHRATIEDVVDEADLRHPAPPLSASVLEAPEDTSAPSWVAPMSSKAAGKQKASEAKSGLDTQSHDLFPELGGPKTQAAPKVAPIWSMKKPTANGNGINGKAAANGSPRTSTPTSGASTPNPAAGQPMSMAIPGRHSERISLAPQQMLPRSQLKRPLPDVLKDINRKSKATVTMNSGQQGLVWFTATGPQDACRQALKDVVEQVGAKQSVKVPIPSSARAQIIGKQGATIKLLQEKTGARIQMPKQEDGPARGDEDDDATVDVLIEGNALAAEMARQEVLKIAGERAANVNQKLKGIPAEFYPFIAGPKNSRVNALEEGKGIQIHVPVHHTWTAQAPPSCAPGQVPNFQPAPNGDFITISGDRTAVQDVRAEIERQVEELRRQLTLEQLPINKGRHQFIVGPRGIPVEDFLADTGCAIILPGDDEDEIITIIGPPDQVQAGVDRAISLASSMNSTNIDISRNFRNAPGGAAAHARNLTRYLQQRKEIERLERLYDAHIVTPMLAEGIAPWELYSRDGKNAIRAQSEINNILNGHPPSRISSVPVDPFFYPHLRDDIQPKVAQDYGVQLVLPENEADEPVLLVFEGPAGLEPEYQVPRSQPSATEVKAFQRGLEDARNHILEIIKGQQQIVSETLEVPHKYHDKLRRFIKREQQERERDQIPVRVSASGTNVTLRGPASSVESLATKVRAFVAQEIEDEKERGFTMSFNFPQAHAKQLIGRGGANIRELRERFDVDIQVNDGIVELKGPKAKAEAAKSHITALAKQWADEATYVLKVEPKYHRELIGASGNQINRLQTRYKVQIHFPRAGRPAKDDQSVTDAASDAGQKKGRNQAEDEVIVRGPKKGADEAREEILSLLQYLKDNSFTATVSVQQGQLPSLIGPQGAHLDELRTSTGAKIDVPGSRDVKTANGLVDIQIKGTKSQVAAAKKILEEKKSVFDQTVTKTIEVDKKYHKALIGAGGSNLRDIVVKAGGSDDRRELARTVQFPRAGDEGNTIKVEGNETIVNNIIKAMQEHVSQRESQVSEVVDVATDKHRSLIGRGGDVKRDLETKFGVSINIPRQGSGETGVKIVGQPSNVEKAKDHILDMCKEQEGVTVQVPKKFHHVISDNGQFFRRARSDHQVSIDHAGQKVPPKAAPPTRPSGGALPLITDDQDAAADAFSWNVVDSSQSHLEGDIPWILRGSPENIAKVQSKLESALKQASQNTATGYLVLPDPKTYRYVIGQGGSKVNSIRKATDCKIQVPRNGAEDEAIEILGTAEGVEKAKDLILQAVKDGQKANGRA